MFDALSQDQRWLNSLPLDLEFFEPLFKATTDVNEPTRIQEPIWICQDDDSRREPILYVYPLSATAGKKRLVCVEVDGRGAIDFTTAQHLTNPSSDLLNATSRAGILPVSKLGPLGAALTLAEQAELRLIAGDNGQPAAQYPTVSCG